MRRILFILTLATISSALYAQIDQVCIPTETAIWYLERDEECSIRAELNKIDSAKITNLTKQIVLRDSVISSYRNDSTTYIALSETYKATITLKNKEIKFLRCRLRKQKALTTLTLIATGVLIIIGL
jgi:hypothetical protein